jgi:hypothetical protein
MHPQWRAVKQRKTKRSKAFFVVTTYDRRQLMEGRVEACSLIENGEEIIVVANGMQAILGIIKSWLCTFYQVSNGAFRQPVKGEPSVEWGWGSSVVLFGLFAPRALLT